MAWAADELAAALGLFVGLTVGTTVAYLVLRRLRLSALAGIRSSVSEDDG